jgi:hypothetical protein
MGAAAIEKQLMANIHFTIGPKAIRLQLAGESPV